MKFHFSVVGLVTACGIAASPTRANAQCLALAPDSTYPFAFTYPVLGLACGDFDADGLNDVAVTALAEYPPHVGDVIVRIMSGQPDGTLARSCDILFESPVTSLAAGDVNHDARLDLVAGTSAAGTPVLRTFLSQSDGTFVPGASYVFGFPVKSIACGDFNGDGFTDLAVTSLSEDPQHYGDVCVRIMRGQPDGTIAFADELRFSADVTALASADFNRDGTTDLAIGTYANTGTPVVQIFDTEPNGHFVPGPSFAYAFPVKALAAGDLDGDGFADLAVASMAEYPPHVGDVIVRAMLGQSDGSLSPAGDFFFPTSVTSLAAGDANLDGRVDLVVGTADALRPIVQVLANHASVGFVPQPQTHSTCPHGTTTFTVSGAGASPFTYRWQVETAPAGSGIWTDLSDGALPGSDAVVSGVGTSTIEISNSDAAAALRYRCRTENPCGIAVSHPAALKVCIADVNCDPVVDLSDFFEFLTCFDQSLPCADVTGEGEIDLADFFDFLNAFDTGC